MNIGTLTGAIEIEDSLSGVLDGIAQRVKQFSSYFDGAMGTVALGAAAGVAAIGSVTGAVIALGNKGSVIQGVEDSFNRLAVQAGSTGDALIGGLSAGVRNTIDSMELMQSTTRLLSSGIKLSVEDMTLMGATAREMGKATGTDAAGGLNTLSQALLTGNTRSLKRFGINIDLIKSETDFARSIGVTRGELNEAERLEARRIAMLSGMRTMLDTLGTSEVTFKERLQQANVAVGNWFDSLAKGVANSPAVNAAFDSIQAALVRTFGGDSQKLLQTILGWVDSFANTVSRAAPTIIGWIGNVRDVITGIWNEIVAFNDRWQITNNIVAGAQFAWGLLKQAFDLVKAAVVAVIAAWESMPGWLQQITRTALEGSIALAAYSVAVNAVSVPFRALIGTFDLGINILGNLTGAIYSVTQLTWLWRIPIDAVSISYVGLTTTMAGSSTAMALMNINTRATTYAKTALTAILTALSAKLGITTALEFASGLASGMLAEAKAFLNLTLIALNLNFNIFAARLGLSTAAMTVSAAATTAGTVAMTALGMALLAIQAIPIVALVLGIAAGLWKVDEAARGLNRALEQGRAWEFLTAKDTDTWARRWTNYFTQWAFGADLFETSVNKVRSATDRLKGGAWQGGEFLPEVQQPGTPGALAGGAAAARLRDEALNAAAGYPTAIAGNERLAGSYTKVGTAGDEAAKRLADVNKKIKELQDGTGVLTEANKIAIVTYKDLGLVEGEIATKIGKSTTAVSMYLAEREKAKEVEKEALLTAQRLASFNFAAVAQEISNKKRLEVEELRLNAARAANIESLDAVAAEYAQKNKERLLTGTALELEKLSVSKTRALADLGERTVANAAYWDAARNKLEAYFDAEKEGLTKSKASWASQLDALSSAFNQIAEIAGDAFGGIVKEIANVISSWNLATKAAEAYGKATTNAQRAASIASGIAAVAQATGSGSTLSRVAGGALAGAAMGSVVPVIGTAIGAGVGAVVGLFRGLSASSKAAKEEVERARLQTIAWRIETDALRGAFFLASGGILELQQRAFTAGVTLKDILDAKTPQAYTKALDELNAALKFQDDAMKLLDDTAKKYGLTLSEMGPRYRQGKLDEEFRILYQDQEILKAGGVDYDLILRKQVDTYKSLIQIAIETGATIPLAMKPAIERMIALGLNVDDTGKELFNLSQLTFAETLDKKFQTLIDVVLRLAEAIERGLSGAILAIPEAPNPFRNWPEGGPGAPGGPRPGGQPGPGAGTFAGEDVEGTGASGSDYARMEGDVYLDARKVGTFITREIPGALKRGGQ